MLVSPRREGEYVRWSAEVIGGGANQFGQQLRPKTKITACDSGQSCEIRRLSKPSSSPSVRLDDLQHPQHALWLGLFVPIQGSVRSSTSESCSCHSPDRAFVALCPNPESSASFVFQTRTRFPACSVGWPTRLASPLERRLVPREDGHSSTSTREQSTRSVGLTFLLMT